MLLPTSSSRLVLRGSAYRNWRLAIRPSSLGARGSSFRDLRFRDLSFRDPKFRIRIPRRQSAIVAARSPFLCVYVFVHYLFSAIYLFRRKHFLTAHTRRSIRDTKPLRCEVRDSENRNCNQDSRFEAAMGVRRLSPVARSSVVRDPRISYCLITLRNLPTLLQAFWGGHTAAVLPLARHTARDR